MPLIVVSAELINVKSLNLYIVWKEKKREVKEECFLSLEDNWMFFIVSFPLLNAHKGSAE